MHHVVAATLVSVGAAHHTHVMASSCTQASQRSQSPPNKGSGKGGPAASQLRPTRLRSAASAAASARCHAAASRPSTPEPWGSSPCACSRACSRASEAASSVLIKKMSGSSSPSRAARKLRAPSHCAAAAAACWLPPPLPLAVLGSWLAVPPGRVSWGGHEEGADRHAVPSRHHCRSSLLCSNSAAIQAELALPCTDPPGSNRGPEGSMKSSTSMKR